jgi:hypothetical protein
MFCVLFQSKMARQDSRAQNTGIRFDGKNFESWHFGVRLVLQSELWHTTKQKKVHRTLTRWHNLKTVLKEGR